MIWFKHAELLVRSLAGLVVMLVLWLLLHSGSLLVAAGAGYWIYDGIRRGMTYHAVVGQQPLRMVISKTENRNGRKFFADFVATGFVTNHGAVEVNVFRDQFHRLEPGNSLDVFYLPSGRWVNHAQLAESLPIFHVAGLYFSWHFVAGIAGLALWFVLMPRLRQMNRDKSEVS